MTQQRTTDDTADCGLHSFERNRFFHGKLMTARDMEAEQRYHRNRLRTLAEHVTGEGIVCGLETTVEAEEDSLVVTIEPGLAIDSCGHPIVVETQAKSEIDIEAVSDPTSLYIDYDNCVKETVPVPGSEDACEEECTYNRILEIFEVSHEPDPPPSDLKAVETVDFPEMEDFHSADDPRNPDSIAAADDALRQIATSYAETEAGALRGCDSGGDHRVFLGRFGTDTNANWSQITDGSIETRPHVYTNDMLYAAVARHAARFDDPHDVTAAQAGALVSVEGVSNPGGDVDLKSPDDSVSVNGDDDANSVDITVADWIQEKLADLGDRVDELEERLGAMERQLLKSTLHHKRLSFRLLAERFDSGAAAEVVELVEEAIESGVHEEMEAYIEFAEAAFEAERAVVEELAEAEAVSEVALAQYAEAVEELEGVLGGDVGDISEAEYAHRVAHAQGLVAETAEWIESQARVEEPPPEPAEDPEFSTGLYGTENGGTAEIVLITGDADEVELRVEDPSGDSYRLEANIETGSYDPLNLGFDTTKAGDPGQQTLTVQQDVSLEVVSETDLDGSFPSGEYDLWLAVPESGGSRDVDSAGLVIEATEEPTEDPQFTSSTYNTETGGTADISLTTGDASEVLVRIGEESEVNYELRARMETGPYDQLTLGFNTANAGTTDQQPLTVQQDVALEIVDETPLDGSLVAATYPLSLSVPESGGPRQVDVASLVVNQATEEPSTNLDSLGDSVERKIEAFRRVRDTFSSDGVGQVATEIIEVSEEGLNSEVYSSADDYRAFIESVADLEFQLNAVLVETSAATKASIGNYATAVKRLQNELENEADVQTLKSAQNAVSTAAANLEPVGSDTTIQPTIDPTSYTVRDNELENVVTSDITTLEDAQIALAYEMAGNNRTTAGSVMLNRIDELESSQ